MNLALRRRIATALVVLSVPALSALSSCSPNFDAPTNRVYTPGRGVNERSGSVDVLHALVVSGSKGSGTVIAALVNNDEVNDDRLVDVAGAGADQGVTVEASGDSAVGAGELYQLADDGNVSVTGDQIQPGRFVALTFSFERGESVTLKVPVVARSGEFAQVPLPASESPSESGAPKDKRNNKRAGSRSGSSGSE